jgi:hypothetical protein
MLAGRQHGRSQAIGGTAQGNLKIQRSVTGWAVHHSPVHHNLMCSIVSLALFACEVGTAPQPWQLVGVFVAERLDMYPS